MAPIALQRFVKELDKLKQETDALQRGVITAPVEAHLQDRLGLASRRGPEAWHEARSR